MGQIVSVLKPVDECFKRHAEEGDGTTTSIPPSNEAEKKATPAAAAAAPKSDTKAAPAAAKDTAKPDEEPYVRPKASEAPVPPPTPSDNPDFVTDGKVYFHKDALNNPAVMKTRDEEVAALELAIQTKSEAIEATKKANELHDAGKIDDSKPFRAEAKEKHAKALDLQKAAAESMLIKAIHSDKPEIDYHVFLLEGFTETFSNVWERMKNDRVYKDNNVFLVIPGAGTHSVGKPLIKPKLFEFLDQNNIKYEEETHGSYRCYLS